MSRPWSDKTLHETSARMWACAVEYHAAVWDDPLLRDESDRARHDLRKILDYRLSVRNACTAIRAGASLSEAK